MRRTAPHLAGGVRVAALAALAATGGACEQPEEPVPPTIETAYLLDRIDGVAPPAPVCEAGSATQLLRFESIALADDGSYGRLQEIQVDGGTPIQQEERGEFERADSTIVLRSAGGGVVVLALLDSAGVRARRIHTCGDTLVYASVPVADP